MKAYRVVVHGLVQGVSFRRFARTEAARYHVTGWVRNDPGGTVTAYACGAPEALASWLAQLKIGPAKARVATLTIDEVPVIQFEQFDIVRHD